ncbi:SNF2 family domain-containing protein [Plectosphaerella plurivora]|uniref:SNF2 family domain-containing protein n=1 Tax=Plectosphaerella plurivora TaxID=936078 RepID=A0A9P8V3C3_9PEZI|nr:SNF2 family domain-containing protein [Plectosphaerella plurivora]
MTSDTPPAKRPRFFDGRGRSHEDEDGMTASSIEAVPLRLNDSTDVASISNTAEEPKDVPKSSPAPPREPLLEQPVEHASNRSPSHNTFDQGTFESFIGDKIDVETLNILQDKCGTDLERAINMYFDGTWKKFRKQGGSVRAPAAAPPTAPARPKLSPHASNLSKMPGFRYVGALGAEGWVTRSGSCVLQHGDPILIQRQKIEVPTPKGKGAGRKSAMARRVDIVVKITNHAGVEIGRLDSEAAIWVSTLIDQKICKFEGTCVYAPEVLRTNDTIFIQLHCYLLPSAFKNNAFTDAEEDRPTSLFDRDETTKEKELRLRQVALVKLLQEVNLEPTRTNSSSERRKELLKAAERDEQKTKEAERLKASQPSTQKNGGSSPPSEEAEDGVELEQDQLDTLYRKAQSFDFNTPEAEPADTFALNLRPYQKQALHWMLSKEKDLKSHREPSMHPLWEEYTWPIKDVDGKDLPVVEEQTCFYVNPYSGDLSLEFPKQEQNCLGGILADEMGLGKTIQMLSLVHSHRADKAEEARKAANSTSSVDGFARLTSSPATVLPAPCTTLVVAPMSLLSQWASEAEKASKEGTIKTMMYYGADKASNNLQAMCCAASAASAPDIVITSYGVILSEFQQLMASKGNKTFHNGIFSLNFFRVILDEGHHIKNRQSKTAKACYEIAAEHRWVLTGTPIVNRLEDLFSLVRFLRVEPWNNFSFWKTFITVPFESKNFMRALDVVQTVLEPLVIRRTKDMKTPDGELLVPLPPKIVEVVHVELSETERAIYDLIFLRAKETFSQNVEAGTVMRAYTSIFAQILRLRQTCCHPLLVRNADTVADEEEAGAAADLASGLADDMDLSTLIANFSATADEEDTNPNAFGAHILGQIRDEESSECPICAEEPMIDRTVTGGCWHSACKKCLLDYMKHQTDHAKIPTCPNCRAVINYRDLFEVVRHDDDPDMFDRPKITLQRLGRGTSSAKVGALISSLRSLRRENPNMKSVVFSQFTSFLSLIEPALARFNMKFVRLDGTMAQKARAAVLDEFQNSDQFTILLISLRAGGVGLNLTSAKRVYMMDPWWSYAVEAQAIDRVHRMGQEDEVKVYRFIVQGSVEERMLRVQERKKFLATSLGMMSDEDKKLQRIEDIKELLSYDATSSR